MSEDLVTLTLLGFEKSGEELLAMELTLAPVSLPMVQRLCGESDSNPMYDSYPASADQISKFLEILGSHLKSERCDLFFETNKFQSEKFGKNLSVLEQ